VNLETLAEILTRRLAAPVSWTTALVLGIVVLAVGILIYRLAFTLLHRLSRKMGTSLDDLLIKRMRTPARGLIVLGAFHVVLLARADQLLSIRNGVAIIELLLVAYIVVEFAETLVLHYWFGERQGVEVPAVVRHLILVVFYVVAALSIIGSVTGINLSGAGAEFLRADEGLRAERGGVGGAVGVARGRRARGPPRLRERAEGAR
jgi:hypothetical protein